MHFNKGARSSELFAFSPTTSASTLVVIPKEVFVVVDDGFYIVVVPEANAWKSSREALLIVLHMPHAETCSGLS